MLHSGAPRIAQLDHPDIQQPVVRGPLPNNFQVTELLRPDRGADQGLSSVVRKFPVLSRLGIYRSGDIRNPGLDEKWACAEMGFPNIFRRTTRLYVLPKTDQRLPQAMQDAAQAMFRVPHYDPGLYTLDHDAEILKYKGYYADFHPTLRHPYPHYTLVILRLCMLDPEEVRSTEVNRIVDSLTNTGTVRLGEISHLPRTLTNFFLSMYRSEIARLEAEIRMYEELLRRGGVGMPRNLPQLIADDRAEIARLQALVAQLEAYQRRLPEIERSLAERFLQSQG